jgi:hypothetical protein
MFYCNRPIMIYEKKKKKKKRIFVFLRCDSSYFLVVRRWFVLLSSLFWWDFKLTQDLFLFYVIFLSVLLSTLLGLIFLLTLMRLFQWIDLKMFPPQCCCCTSGLDRYMLIHKSIEFWFSLLATLALKFTRLMPTT